MSNVDQNGEGMVEKALEIHLGISMKEKERKGTARTKSWGRRQREVSSAV